MLPTLFRFIQSQKPNKELAVTVPKLIDFAVSAADKPEFSQMISGENKNMLIKLKSELDKAKNMLVGKNYSLMTILTYLDDEGEETTKFLDTVDDHLKNNFEHTSYLLGNSALSREMENTFGKELAFIMLLSAVSIFIVVLLTFRSVTIPLMLVLLVQCGVFITVSIVGLQGYNIYYLALLMVQCILMGATIDYGILFTNYYREKRKEKEPLDALIETYDGSIHTVTTSGLIIILVTAIIGWFFKNPTISQICRTISMGALCTVILVLFVLPSLLTCFDRFVIGRRRKKKETDGKNVPDVQGTETEEKPEIETETEEKPETETEAEETADTGTGTEK